MKSFLKNFIKEEEIPFHCLSSQVVMGLQDSYLQISKQEWRKSKVLKHLARLVIEKVLRVLFRKPWKSRMPWICEIFWIIYNACISHRDSRFSKTFNHNSLVKWFPNVQSLTQNDLTFISTFRHNFWNFNLHHSSLCFL